MIAATIIRPFEGHPDPAFCVAVRLVEAIRQATGRRVTAMRLAYGLESRDGEFTVVIVESKAYLIGPNRPIVDALVIGAHLGIHFEITGPDETVSR